MKILQTQPKRHRLGFDQSGWNNVEQKIAGVREQMENLSQLLKETGIKDIDVHQLLLDPYKTLLPHVPEPFQNLGKSLSNPALLKWDLFDGFPDIVSWAQRNSTNIDLINYRSYYMLDGTVDESKLAELKERHTRYTEGEKQAHVFTEVKEIVDRLNALQEKVGRPWLELYSSGTGDLAKPFRRVGTQYVVNEDFITTF
jgi:hypothetical protein